jgi:hypothetical protein
LVTVDPRLWAFYNPGNLAITYTNRSEQGWHCQLLSLLADADQDNVDNSYAPAEAMS